MENVEVQNWFGDITSHPRVVVEARSVDDIIEVVKDRARYPSPVRAVGSNHSVAPCNAVEGGTLVLMRGMDRILEIRGDRVRVEAGALYIDVAQELERHHLQFYVNVEVGNLTMGSAACCQTKDASMPGEYAQVCSYAVGLKMVSPSGDLIEFTEEDGPLLEAARSSYGLFGIVYEVTFRVRPLAAMRVRHERFTLDEFAQQWSALRERNESMMMYIDPYLDRITVEFRIYHEGLPARPLTRWQWRLRDFAWSHTAPLYAHLVSTYVPFAGPRRALLDSMSRVLSLALVYLVRGENTAPAAQQIRYPARSNSSRYTFSIWAFPEASYLDGLRRYFQFCGDYYRTYRYRTDMLSVGYRVAQDTNSLLSYSYDGIMMTFDPVSTGNDGWEEFVRAYNQLCSELGGRPLLNQTNHLTREQVDRAYGQRAKDLEAHRRRFDPDGRLLNEYFSALLSDPAPGADK